MRRLIIALVMAALIPGAARPASAESGVEVTEVGVQYNFGEQITFQARIQSSIPILQASLLFRDDRDGVTRVQPVEIAPDGRVAYRYEVTQNVLPPFVEIIFWFEGTLQGGGTFTSPQYRFRYADNRFPWQSKAEGPLRLHWYDGDEAFGQAALDTARLGLAAMSELILPGAAEPLDIYVYAAVEDLQSALYLGGEPWIAGHASPELGVVMVSIPPGASQRINMERQIPHELAHVRLYRQVGPGYERLPVWLREGIASIMELYPNPDYARTLSLASQNGSLLPIAELCATFPADTARAFLAYAEAESFTRYLRETYGDSALRALIAAYADGLNCEQGAQQALGASLSYLERRWREAALGENPLGHALRNLAPYLLVLGLMLLIPLWGFGAGGERRPDGSKP